MSGCPPKWRSNVGLMPQLLVQGLCQYHTISTSSIIAPSLWPVIPLSDLGQGLTQMSPNDLLCSSAGASSPQLHGRTIRTVRVCPLVDSKWLSSAPCLHPWPSKQVPLLEIEPVSSLCTLDGQLGRPLPPAIQSQPSHQSVTSSALAISQRNNCDLTHRMPYELVSDLQMTLP